MPKDNKQDKPLEKIVASIGEYKGHKMLTLSRGSKDKWPVRFGLRKAKAIVEAGGALVAFVNSDGANLGA